MKTPLQNFMDKFPDGIDGALIMSPKNRRYLTGVKSSAGTVVITKKSAYFIIDFRYIEMAKATVKNAEVIQQKQDLHAQIGEIFEKDGVTRVGFESNFVTVEVLGSYKNKLEKYEFVENSEVSNILQNLRSIKSEEELGYIRKAQQITDSTFEHMLTYIKKGMSELEIVLELEYTLKKLGADGLAFDSIVVSGEQGCQPHGVPSEKILQEGDLLTMDFGALYNGYCSDMTRTVAIGEISDEQRKIYDTVLMAQLKALDFIKSGVLGQEVDKIARDYIYESGYEGYFGHGLGHSLGLDIHEFPSCSAMGKKALKENMLMTVEPGIYIPGKCGVRIEDLVIITENGCEILTKSPKHLITL